MTANAINTKRLVLCAMFAAIGVFLAGPLSFPVNVFGLYSIDVSLGVVPVILAGVLFGPVYGGMVGGVVDFGQAMLFPIGGYNPLFTISGVIFGLVPGLFFMRGAKASFPRIFMATLAGQIVGSVILNSLWLVISYGMLWEVALIRAAKQAIFIPIYAALVFALTKVAASVDPSFK